MIDLSGPLLQKYDPNSAIARDLNSIALNLSKKDSTLWGEAARAEAANRLDWLTLPTESMSLIEEIKDIKLWMSERKLENIILCGMGGSSLAPEVFGKTFSKSITIIDSTDPNQINAISPDSLANTLFIVGSKSGSTIETASQKLYFESRLMAEGLNPKDHFLIITDPASPLDESARKSGYKVVNANPNVGGRFSALSAFGIVPAGLLGIDIAKGLNDATSAAHEFVTENSVAIKVATLLTEQAEQCIAFSDAGSNVPGISDWIEQLIAESTGKDGKGRIPVVIEDFGADIGGDVPLISFSSGSADLAVEGNLFEQFIFWEWVTALMGRALSVDPFNQPNVTEAKERTAKILESWPPTEPTPNFESDNLKIFAEKNYSSLDAALVQFLIPDSKYLAIMAYLNRIIDAELVRIREILASKLSLPVTFGWGPRFLHSTGQFHKGGPLNGKFLQITGESDLDLAIPEKSFSFHDLLMAQALGDGQALSSRELPLLRIHLKNRALGISEIIAALKKL